MNAVKMNGVKAVLPWRPVLLGVLLAGLAGCATYYRDGPPYYSSAHHYHPYHYHYYPGPQVYFHISSGYYYYRDGAHWHRAKQLPPHYHLDRHDRVRIWSDRDKPHSEYPAHQGKYRPRRDYKPDTARDPEERQHNQQLHERYRDRDHDRERRR